MTKIERLENWYRKYSHISIITTLLIVFNNGYKYSYIQNKYTASCFTFWITLYVTRRVTCELKGKIVMFNIVKNIVLVNDYYSIFFKWNPFVNLVRVFQMVCLNAWGHILEPFQKWAMWINVFSKNLYTALSPSWFYINDVSLVYFIWSYLKFVSVSLKN